MKLNVRLSKENRTIAQILSTNHKLEGPIKDWNNIPKSELFYGQSYDSEPSWTAFLQDGTTTLLTGLKNQGAAAILFVSIGNHYLIYLFGYGFLSLQDGSTIWDFGIKVVLNSINAAGIKSLDSRTLNNVKPKNTRVQLGGQGGIEEFDFDIMQNLVSNISGLSVDTAFAKSLTGGESLIISTDLTGSSIIKKSKEIIKKYKLVKYKKDFEWIDHISPIKDEQLIHILTDLVKDDLNNEISGQSSNNIVLSFPEIIDYGNFDYLKFNGYGDSDEYLHLDLELFIMDYNKFHGGLLSTSELLKLQVDLYNPDSKRYSSFRLIKCINTQVTYGHKHYILASGSWFELEDNYFRLVNGFFETLLLNVNEFRGTEQTSEENEQGYLTHTFPNHELLDRNLFKSYGQKNTIEYADLITKKEIIHVKDGKSSSMLSHLFNQGYVCAKLLVNDSNFLSSFGSVIVNQDIANSFNVSKFRPEKITIVYRILKSGNALTLPFFSKIMLYDTYKKIKQMRYKFRLDWVKYI